MTLPQRVLKGNSANSSPESAIEHVARGWQLLIESDSPRVASIIEHAGEEAFGEEEFSEAMARAVETARWIWRSGDATDCAFLILIPRRLSTHMNIKRRRWCHLPLPIGALASRSAPGQRCTLDVLLPFTMWDWRRRKNDRPSCAEVMGLQHRTMFSVQRLTALHLLKLQLPVYFTSVGYCFSKQRLVQTSISPGCLDLTSYVCGRERHRGWDRSRQR